LIQVETQLGQRVVASDRSKAALEWYPYSFELKVYRAKQDLEEGELKAALKGFLGVRNEILEYEIPTLWFFEALFQSKRSSEILSIQKGLLKRKPDWIELRFWLLKNGTLYPEQVGPLRSEIDKALAEPLKLSERKESEYRQGQYYWVSALSTEQLKREYLQWIGP
jgi:hypothetical protein